MIGTKIDWKQFDWLRDELKKVDRAISSGNMQKHRAKKFRDYTVEYVKNKQLSLWALSPITKILSGDHNPEWFTGELLKQMKAESISDREAHAGYFGPSSIAPTRNKEYKLTYNQIAKLQHTGYRIPLTGEKGARVRKWLGYQLKQKGDKFGREKSKSNRNWLIVPPRPFVYISYNKYIAAGEDIKAVDEYLQKAVEGL